jgi:hypothetical protein
LFGRIAIKFTTPVWINCQGFERFTGYFHERDHFECFYLQWYPILSDQILIYCFSMEIMGRCKSVRCGTAFSCCHQKRTRFNSMERVSSILGSRKMSLSAAWSREYGHRNPSFPSFSGSLRCSNPEPSSIHR